MKPGRLAFLLLAGTLGLNALEFNGGKLFFESSKNTLRIDKEGKPYKEVTLDSELLGIEKYGPNYLLVTRNRLYILDDNANLLDKKHLYFQAVRVGFFPDRVVLYTKDGKGYLFDIDRSDGTLRIKRFSQAPEHFLFIAQKEGSAPTILEAHRLRTGTKVRPVVPLFFNGEKALFYEKGKILRLRRDGDVSPAETYPYDRVYDRNALLAEIAKLPLAEQARMWERFGKASDVRRGILLTILRTNETITETLLERLHRSHLADRAILLWIADHATARDRYRGSQLLASLWHGEKERLQALLERSDAKAYATLEKSLKETAPLKAALSPEERRAYEKLAAETEALGKRLEAERLAEERRKMAPYLEPKRIGDMVCLDGRMTFGLLHVTIKGYVENVAGDKIQIRIASTDGLHPRLNGVDLYQNTIVWDRYDHWRHCR
ncbi:hypothetical protein [Hydrogenimonas sp.]